MNPYESPPPPESPETTFSRGPSRGFVISLAGICLLLLIVLGLPLVRYYNHQQLRREAQENIRQLDDALQKFQKREAAK